MNYLADSSYVAIKPQVDAATPIRPTLHFPLVGENIRLNAGIVADRRMKGFSWKSDDIQKGAKSIAGDLTLFADPAGLGHLLNMLQLKGSSTGSGTDGYTHPFTPGAGKNYTIEIPVGIYAERYFGVRADGLALSFDDGRLLGKLTVKAVGVFRSAELAGALTGAGMTAATFKTVYEVSPNKGLCIGDTIIVGGVEVVLTSVDAGGLAVGFASTAITAAVGDKVYLKAQTPSFGTQLEPFYRVNTLVGVGATETDSTTAAGAEATSVGFNDLSIEFKNNLLAADQVGRRGAGGLFNQTLEGQIKIKKMFDTPQDYQDWLSGIGEAMTIISMGKPIKSDFTTSEKLTMKFYLAKRIEHQEPKTVGGYVIAEETFEILLDQVTSKSVEIALVNRTAGTVY